MVSKENRSAQKRINKALRKHGMITGIHWSWYAVAVALCVVGLWLA